MSIPKILELENRINDGENTDINLVWENGITEIDGTENSIKINKLEKSCTLTFAVNSNNQINGSYKLGSFNADYAPKKQCIGSGVCSISGSIAPCQLSVFADRWNNYK